jgi:hypothetical protein
MTSQAALKEMLTSCTLRLDTSRGPQGTAFFVAPGYAITAAHLVDGAKGTRVYLKGRAATWSGHIQDVRPGRPGDSVAPSGLYPAPDIALIHVADGPAHPCVLLGTQENTVGSDVMVLGHSRTIDGVTVMAESECFKVTGELETPDPGCTLLKLGLGQAVMGMSGGPVLSLHTGEVIGMLRTSRNVHTSLGAWIVPAALLRDSWPREVGGGHDRFHETDSRWRWMSRKLSGSAHAAPAGASPEQPGGPAIGSVHGPVAFITDSHFRDVNIGTTSPQRSPGENGGQGAPDGK